MFNKEQRVVLQQRVKTFFVNDHQKIKIILQSHVNYLVNVYQTVANFILTRISINIPIFEPLMV